MGPRKTEPIIFWDSIIGILLWLRHVSFQIFQSHGRCNDVKSGDRLERILAWFLFFVENQNICQSVRETSNDDLTRKVLN